MPQADSFKAFTLSNISLNISLNGDLNLRNFEILSAKSFLLTDKLSDESGLSLLLENGKDYESYSSIDELIEKLITLLLILNQLYNIEKMVICAITMNTVLKS